MKKFIVRGTCFVAIGLALLALINHFYIRTNGYRSLDDTYKYYLMPEDIEVANFGSSHGAYGIFYDELEGVNGFNFALPGQGLYYDQKILEKYSGRLADSCVVIIPLSYFSFDLEIGTDIQNRWYYKFLGYRAVPNHNLTEYIRHGLCPFLSASFNAKYLVADRESMDFNIFWIFDYFGHHLDVNDERAWRKDARGFLEFFNSVTGGEYVEANTSFLEGMIEYCEERGFKPVLVTTPFTKYFNKLFRGEVLDDFRARVDEVREKYDVPYLDYSSDPRITKHLEFFSDSNHLNDAGRKAFTQILLTDLGLI